MFADVVNACFEFFGACVLLLNVRRLRRDQSLRGVSVVPCAFFAAWGYWNIYYYLAVSSPLSWAAGLLVALVNTTWLAMALRVLQKERRVVKELLSIYDGIDALDRNLMMETDGRGYVAIVARKDQLEARARELEGRFLCARDAAAARSSGGCLPAR